MTKLLEFLTPEHDYFTDDGERVHLVGCLASATPGAIEVTGYVVNRYVTADYGDGESNDWLADFPHVVHRLHRRRPQPRQSPQAKAFEEGIAALLEERVTLNEELAKLREAMQDARRDLAAYPDFGLAMDFLEGRITHMVVIGNSDRPKIMLTPAAVAPTNYRGEIQSGAIRLLSLTGTYDKKGQRVVDWRVYYHSDGSGNSGQTFIPCRSLEEAEEHVRRRFKEAVDNWRASPVDKASGRRWGWWALQEWEKVGVTLEWPADLVAEINMGMMANAEAAQRRAEEEAEKAAKMPTMWVPLSRNVDAD